MTSRYDPPGGKFGVWGPGSGDVRKAQGEVRPRSAGVKAYDFDVRFGYIICTPRGFSAETLSVSLYRSHLDLVLSPLPRIQPLQVVQYFVPEGSSLLPPVALLKSSQTFWRHRAVNGLGSGSAPHSGGQQQNDYSGIISNSLQRGPRSTPAIVPADVSLWRANVVTGTAIFETQVTPFHLDTLVSVVLILS